MSLKLINELQRFSKEKMHQQSLFITWLPTQERLKFLLSSLLVIGFMLFTSPFSNGQEELVGLTSNGGPEGRGTAFSIKPTGANFAILKGFADWGKTPYGDLVKGNDGNFYGMTYFGGTFNYGTVFMVSSSGNLTVLRQLDYATDGGYPQGSLVKGNDGNLYGMTSSGGIKNGGTIFKITSTGAFTIIYNFSGSTDGRSPRGDLTLGKDGNFYGITYGGGSFGYGTIFKVSPSGTFTTLKSLNYTTDGGNSYGSLVQGKDGNFYGITYWGGTYKYGTIFKITPTGTFTVLRHLNGPDGVYSEGSLVQANDGNFYGMAYRGGTNYNGTIFRISSTGTFKVMRNLMYRTDGADPQGSLTLGSDGNLYGLQFGGGTNGHGTIFKMTTAGTYTVLRSLTLATDGGYPRGSLYRNSDGNFYGMTSDGGSSLFGTIFKITPTGTFTVISRLNGSFQGNAPYSNLIRASDGAYYGTTTSGGKYNQGTIFKMCGGIVTVLRSLNRSSDGAHPKGSLVQGTDGNFYGMNSEGGTYGYGTIFKITSSGTFTLLRHLNGSTDGGYPKGGFVQGNDGSFYGMTYSGGSKAGGTIFKITSAGTFTVLRPLSGSTDGANPEGSLVKGTDGNFYGMTTYNARIFKITPTGTFTILRTLSGTDGSSPAGSLVLGKDGNFYGTASTGGTNFQGTIFSISPTGTFKVLRHLSSATDGSAPKGNLVQASDDNFYGMTSTGGTNKVGTIFKISTTGTFTVLRHFNLLKDGGNAYGSLLVTKNPLIANAQNVTTGEDTPKTITLTGSGGSPLTFNIISAPKFGTLSGTGATRTYTPNANYSGPDSFTFTVSVGCITSAPATVSISISSVNDAPVLATIGSKTVQKGAKQSFTATATDLDAGQTRTFSLVSAPAGATIGATSGVFSWTPSVTGSFTFKVKVTDNGSPVLFDEEQLTVTVTSTTTGRLAAENQPEEVGSIEASLYPNPAIDKVIVTSNVEIETAAILITDIKGSAINSYTYHVVEANKLEVEVSALQPGIYILSIQTPSGPQILKFVKR